jgi:hypothetical protein
MVVYLGVGRYYDEQVMALSILQAHSRVMNDVPRSSLRQAPPTLRAVLGGEPKRTPTHRWFVRSAALGLIAGVLAWLLAATLGFPVVLRVF